jgi:transcriptional regulator with XRE-family HTH domain
MDNLIESASKNIAFNLSNLRNRKSMSQLQLANLTGLTRASIAQFETGSANPSLDSLLKLSQGLQISINELISSPLSECTHIKAEDVPIGKKSKQGVTIRKLLPDKNNSTDIDELILNSGATLTGSPHVEGTREYFTCTRGEIIITVLGSQFKLKKGDVLSFPGNKPHSYRNSEAVIAQGFSVVIFSAN